MRRGEDKSSTANVAELIAAYIDGSIRLEQVKELQAWINENPVHDMLFRYFTNPAFASHARNFIWN